MTVLLVCHAFDWVAAAVATQLEQRGGVVRCLEPSALVNGSLAYERTDGLAWWTVDTPAGRLCSRELTAALNRTADLDPLGFDPVDERYAFAERAALIAAMLAVLPGPVLNRSNGATLSGPVPAPLQWHARAARVGLPVQSVRLTTDGAEWGPIRHDLGTVTVVGGQLVRESESLAWSLGWHTELVALAESLGCDLLDVRWGVDECDRPVVTQIDPFPRFLGPVALDAIATVLAGGVGAARDASAGSLGVAS